ncbi:MAG: YebC/PmpR family DNA-binding transcriptional regulator [Clostridia bacterium]|nr:YebC/PmpR family DNA-binding transcriptional regulator [Clostridia bacterium]
MSGHSKWNNIKRKKEKTDSQRAKIFTKIGRELSVAVKEGGPDPEINSKLRDCISKAKSNDVPNDNIERIIKKAASSTDGSEFESITYEGYGPHGVAIIVETLTDNRNRTAGNLRHYFSKYGGNLGSTGCVSFMFSPKGVIILENSGENISQVEEDIINSGAIDFETEDENIIIYMQKEDYEQVYSFLKNKKHNIISSEIEMIPDNYTELTPEESEKVDVLLEILDEDEDVKNVYHNLK